MENPFEKYTNIFNPSIGKFSITLIDGNYHSVGTLSVKVIADCSVQYGNHDLKSIDCNLYSIDNLSGSDIISTEPIIGAESLVSTYYNSKESIEINQSNIYKFEHTFTFDNPFVGNTASQLGINVDAIFISGKDGSEIHKEILTSVLSPSYLGDQNE
ncbi:hypothetical protein [Pediococcus argentinicus]|uniref:Uncharacterized protein n=1 Tax=Pediococcus argentinicus TaxID=480391 RepID=A0A0R2NLX4_9LACO|nr:hypothetical protein [Pediococcus argentinicus]KRO25659.1 hypothetical protein IV88_GL001617 [Pediococcus argentinicus]NKZ22004.1 hypothetical protein [Pediococcus argentinicus]GEP19173.1 hypothetical protein LSA03_05570 [Pediococcus argentinicus]